MSYMWYSSEKSFTIEKEQIKNSLDAMDSQTPLIVFDDENGYRLAEYDLSLMSDQAVNIKYISLGSHANNDRLFLFMDKDSFCVFRRHGFIYSV